jgi:DNA-binding NarL/FixJ family response regulator
VELPVTIMVYIRNITSDIDECFLYVEELIDRDLEPWRTLATVAALDDLRRQYILEAAANGMSVSSIASAAKLSPKAVRTILDSAVSADT